MDHQVTHNTQVQSSSPPTDNRVKTGPDKSIEAVDSRRISTPDEKMNDAILKPIEFSPTVMPYPNQQPTANTTGIARVPTI